MSASMRTIPTGSNVAGVLGNRLSHRIGKGEQREVTPVAIVRATRSREARVDLEQLRRPGAVAAQLHVGGPAKSDLAGAAPAACSRARVVERARDDRDARVDAQTDAGNRCSDVPVAADQHVDRVLVTRQVLLDDQAAVVRHAVESGGVVHDRKPAPAAAGPRLDGDRELPGAGLEVLVEQRGCGG